MRCILGIDPAWTVDGSSGVALLVEAQNGRWRCAASASAYGEFLHQCDVHDYANGRTCDPRALLDAVRSFTGRPPEIVVADIPIASVEITGRREADDRVSKAFGARGAPTHTPNRDRPGDVGKRLALEFAGLGYPVATTATVVGTPFRLLETYPHPALIALTSANYRLPYKVQRVGRYWPELPVGQRRVRLLETWATIVDALGRDVDWLPPLPAVDSRIRDLKGFEDILDAFVTAWVGIQYLNANVEALGDATAAIWLPKPRADARSDRLTGSALGQNRQGTRPEKAGAVVHSTTAGNGRPRDLP